MGKKPKVERQEKFYKEQAKKAVYQVETGEQLAKQKRLEEREKKAERVRKEKPEKAKGKYDNQFVKKELLAKQEKVPKRVNEVYDKEHKERNVKTDKEHEVRVKELRAKRREKEAKAEKVRKAKE